MWQILPDISRPKKHPKAGLCYAKHVANSSRHFKAEKTSKGRPLLCQTCGKCFQTFQGRENIQRPAFVMPNMWQMFSDISRPRKHPKAGLCYAKHVANVFRHF